MRFERLIIYFYFIKSSPYDFFLSNPELRLAWYSLTEDQCFLLWQISFDLTAIFVSGLYAHQLFCWGLALRDSCTCMAGYASNSVIQRDAPGHGYLRKKKRKRKVQAKRCWTRMWPCTKKMFIKLENKGVSALSRLFLFNILLFFIMHAQLNWLIEDILYSDKGLT